MADTHLISGLIRKRAELAGELAKLRQRLDATNSDLAAVDRVLKIAGYDGKPDTDIRPIQRRENGTRPGSLSNAVMDILREASEPMSTSAMSDIIAERRGLSSPNSTAREDFREHVRQGIRRLRQKGVVEMVGTGRVTAWRLTA